MGLFDKKYCDVCGEKIGLLGNRKLEDGNLCKNCAKKLSRWFNERRHSSVDDIKAQLAYREENKKKVAQFRTAHSFGDDWYVLFDDTHRWVTVSKTSSPNENENPDIIDYASVTGCRLDIDERKSEIYCKNSEGKNVSYDPPRYKYYYDFKLVINVDNPYFDEIDFSLSDGSVCYEPEQTVRVSFLGRSVTDSADPEKCFEYCKYRDMGQDICNEFDRIRNIGCAAQPAQPAAASAMTVDNGTWNCVSCGMQNTGKFCEGCGTPKPASKTASCSNCGWTSEPGRSVPKFCPECGTRISQ